MKRVLITLFSVGWLAPTWLAFETYLGFWRYDGWKLLWGRKDVSSFPVIEFSQQSLTIGIIWLAAVIIFWSWKFSGNGSSKQIGMPETGPEARTRNRVRSQQPTFGLKCDVISPAS
jgi:hypothetical protein